VLFCLNSVKVVGLLVLWLLHLPSTRWPKSIPCRNAVPFGQRRIALSHVLSLRWRRLIHCVGGGCGIGYQTREIEPCFSGVFVWLGMTRIDEELFESKGILSQMPMENLRISNACGWPSSLAPCKRLSGFTFRDLLSHRSDELAHLLTFAFSLRRHVLRLHCSMHLLTSVRDYIIPGLLRHLAVQ
jgi:hypothetical protein